MKRPARTRRGITLIELVVALGIVVVLFAAVIYGVGALTGAKAKEASAELAGTIRALYDTAALSGKTCRLVFELPQKNDEDGAVRYHAECAKGSITAGADRVDEQRAAEKKDKDEKRRAEANDRFRSLASDDSGPNLQELMAREKNRVEEAAKFSNFTSEDVPERSLPGGVEVEVWTSKLKVPTKSGVAYLYFFPQGFTERAQIYVKQGKNTWTLAVSPLTGKTVIHAEALELPRS
ncbi:MAG: type II secretion system protein [Myxococcaceae bacterium]|nr:type II secretion system protein [Myxococcaceae bacterium]